MNDDLFYCPIDAVLSLIGGKYKPIILYNLLKGKRRYSELQRLVPRATPKVLTQQLRELERDGLIHREMYPEIPPKVEYTLTQRGQSLVAVLDKLCDWGMENRPGTETKDNKQKERENK